MQSKVAIVTGASSGVGGAIALELARGGYELALVGRNQARLNAIETKINAVGGGSRIFTAELNTVDGINALITQLKQTFTRIDVLVNAAAIWHGDNEVYAGKEFASFPQTVVTDTMMVGIIAPMLLSHALIPLMPSNSHIINISGEFHYGGKGWVSYFTSKRSVEDFTLALADDLKDKLIYVNCISPAEVSTPAYQKYYPQYIQDCISPGDVAVFASKICSSIDHKTTGKVFFMAKDHPVSEKFHA